MKTLDKKQVDNLKNIFLKNIGKKITEKRTHKSISMEVLANCLGVSKQTVYFYEKGKTDFPVTMLPLISTYCDFPVTEYFDKELTKTLSETFSSLVEITKHKYQRAKQNVEPIQSAKIERVNGKEIKGYIVDDDGKDAYIEKEDVISEKMVKEPSIREKYVKGEMPATVQPFSGKEFVEYLDGRDNIILALDGANKLLKYIGDAPQKETIKGHIADFLIREIIIEPILRNENDQTKRAYAYYKHLLEERELPEDTSEEPGEIQDVIKSDDRYIDKTHKE